MKVLAIDIGGTFIKYAIMNEWVELFNKGSIKTPDSREALIETLGKLFDEYKKDENIDAISISMPGIIDPIKGYVAMGGALKYNNDFYLADALKKRCPDIKISIHNDAKCAARAEASVGALKDVKDGIVLIFGTMIGGGLVLNGEVRNGFHFSAGEVSFILSDKDANPDYDTVFGNRCGVPELCRMYAKKKCLKQEEVDGVLVFEAVNNGDVEAINILKDYTKQIAVQIFNLQTVFDVERIAIGGGISAQPIFIEYIQRHLKTMYELSPYKIPSVDIVRCTYGNDANLVGAVQYAMM